MPYLFNASDTQKTWCHFRMIYNNLSISNLLVPAELLLVSCTSNEGLLPLMIEPLHEVHSIDMVHDSASYKVLYLFLALLAGDVECRVHVLSGGVHSGAMLQKKHHDVDVTQPRGNVKRCLLLLEQKLLQQIVLRCTNAVISPLMYF